MPDGEFSLQLTNERLFGGRVPRFEEREFGGHGVASYVRFWPIADIVTISTPWTQPSVQTAVLSHSSQPVVEPAQPTVDILGRGYPTIPRPATLSHPHHPKLPTMRALQTHPLATTLLFAGAVAIALGLWFAGNLPARERLIRSIATEPLQTPAPSGAEFAAHRGGVDYTVRPLADYEIHGLVVSRHDSDAWWDWIHAASNDHLNVVDLCVVWGANAADGAYEKMKFSSGQFVCYVSTNDSSAWQPQYIRALSNNHLLTTIRA